MLDVAILDELQRAATKMGPQAAVDFNANIGCSRPVVAVVLRALAVPFAQVVARATADTLNREWFVAAIGLMESYSAPDGTLFVY